jgi:exopolysaccharide biosynthesis glucuronosyltransferase PssE
VSVGNAHQTFHRLLEAVERIANLLPQPVIIQYGHTPYHSRRCQAHAFIAMSEYERLISESSLVILHAGGGGVLLAVHAGKVPVLMPRRAKYGEHVDDHQVENAKALAANGNVVVAEEPDDLIVAVEEAMKRQLMPRSSDATSPMVGLISEVLRKYAADLGK